MTHAQHTPGPWFTEALSTIGHCAIIDADGFTIANPSPMGTANARLIAAAPELLDALIATERALNAAYSSEFSIDHDHNRTPRRLAHAEDIWQAILAARAAIAKAKGA